MSSYIIVIILVHFMKILFQVSNVSGQPWYKLELKLKVS